MSLWAQYCREREGYETIESERGFLTYKKVPDGIFIRDMFVRSQDRGCGYGKALFDELLRIAREQNCMRLVCQVDTRANGATESLGVIMSQGFRIVSAEHQVIVLMRDLQNGRSH